MLVAAVDHEVGERFYVYADPAIKLFGRDIPLTSSTSNEASEDLSYQDIKPEIPQTEESNEPMDVVLNESGMPASIDDGNNAVGCLSIKNPVEDIKIKMGALPGCTDIKGEDSQSPSAVSHEKMPKKPDKLIPCPRCNSLDTKFCYFNNYNVNQPRHFCRKCQRYWTAGGTLRNVPVGAGRRKHKHSMSHQKHVIVSDTIPVHTNSADMAHHRICGSFPPGGTALSSPSKPMLHVLPLETHAVSGMDSPSSNRTMFSFGQESPLCKSMAATTLSMQECGAVQNHERFNSNATTSADLKFAAGGKRLSELEGLTGNTTSSSTLAHHDVPATALQNAVSISCPTTGSPAISPIAGAVPPQEGELKVNAGGEVHGAEVSGAAYTNYGGVWQLGNNMMVNTPFNPAAANAFDSESGSNAAPSLPQTNMLACNGAPGSFWMGFPWPLMNPAMWGPPPLDWAGPWTLPFCPPAAAAAAAAAALFPFSGAGSAFEKPQHSEGSQPEKCLWVPKTLRIDDPLDAARSSIWTTLGLGDGPLSSPVSGSTKAFRAKSELKDNNEAINSQQHSNPAASSRSAAFHENS